MNFCPTCGMLLQIAPAKGADLPLRLFCPTCPYVCPIAHKRKIVQKVALVKKEVQPIFSGSDSLKFAPKTRAICPRCHHGQAYFRQMQIRSADEPMTSFYQCCDDSCGHEWRDD